MKDETKYKYINYAEEFTSSYNWENLQIRSDDSDQEKRKKLYEFDSSLGDFFKQKVLIVSAISIYSIIECYPIVNTFVKIREFNGDSIFCFQLDSDIMLIHENNLNKD